MPRALLLLLCGLLAAPLVGACSDGGASAPAPAALPGEAPAADAGALAAAAPEVPADAPLVVFLGDSIAAGLHLSASEAFPAVLQRELVELDLPFRLVNAGVSGDTSAGGLRRVDWILRQAPDVVVVELGGNDGLRGQSPEGVEANLREIVARCRAAGAEVLLLGVRLPPSLGPDYVAAFDALYPRLAGELDLAFVPHFLDGVGGVPELNLEDGLHPTAEGHRRIAERVAPALASLLGRIER
jgi:acyl-CoA thioesterase-1